MRRSPVVSSRLPPTPFFLGTSQPIRLARRSDGQKVLDIPRILGVMVVRLSCLGVQGMARNDLQGSIDLLVLKTLSQMGELHGYGIVLHIQRASDELLSVEEGSLYPALHRMQQNGWIRSEWKVTERNRQAKYYRLTAAGQKELRRAEEGFEQVVKGVRAVLRRAQG